MRIFIIAYLAFYLNCNAQQENGVNNFIEIDPFQGKLENSMVDKWPGYPGGESGLDSDIYDKIVYPPEALIDSIEGRVVVKFVVQSDGMVGEIEIIEGSYELLNSEAIRVIRSLKRWDPAIQNGEAVKMAYIKSINFKI